MTRVIVSLSLFTLALAGCRSPAPTFAPYGPQTVPPPVTGSIGAPAPQAAPYYQGSSTNTMVPQSNVGWHPPSTSLGAQSIAQSQTTTASPAAVAPNANFTSGGAGTFTTPQVTNPAAIGNRNGTIVAPPSAPTNNSVFGAGTRSAQSQPWQPSATTTGSPQLLRANASPVAQPNGAGGQPTTTTTQPATGGGQTNWGQQPANGWPQQPNSQWGQPPINNGTQWQTTPGGVPLGGMPVNDATMAYPASNPSWSMAGVRNWFQQQFGQTGYPAQGYPAQGYPAQGYAVPQPYGQPPIYQAQQPFPAPGYSTAAPAPTPLPVRGTQPQFIPASHTAPQAASGQNAPVAPAAMQWGSVPMASSSPVATVRGNDDSEVSPTGFVTTGQSSPTPHEAELYGNHAEYHWLRGQLEYSLTRRRWKLRYIPLDAPEGRMDAFGGSVVLADTDQFQGFESGDFVTVQGRLHQQDGGAAKIDPVYDVTSVTKL